MTDLRGAVKDSRSSPISKGAPSELIIPYRRFSEIATTKINFFIRLLYIQLIKDKYNIYDSGEIFIYIFKMISSYNL